MGEKNIVLIVVDTLSAFHLPMYGYERNTSPFLQQLADNNSLFKFAYAPAPWTVPSHASLFSGQYPAEHGTTSENLCFTSETFVEELNNYQKIGISNNNLIDPILGFDSGFNQFIGKKSLILNYRGLKSLQKTWKKDRQGEYENRKQKYYDFLKSVLKDLDWRSLKAGVKTLLGREPEPDDSGAEATNKRIKKELASQPFFLFINYMEPHTPYNPPKKIGKKYTDYRKAKKISQEIKGVSDLVFESTTQKERRYLTGLYDAEIRYLDGKIEELHNYITDNFDDTIFIIVGDHGENLGDYGFWEHQFGVFEKLIRVPLIIAGDSIPDKTIEENVSLTELKDFILGEKDIDHLGQETVFAEYHGAKGFSMDYADAKSLSDYSEEEQELWKNTSRAVISGKEGLIEHSHIADQTFQAQADGYDEENAEVEKEKLRQLLTEQYGPQLDDIDI